MKNSVDVSFSNTQGMDIAIIQQFVDNVLVGQEVVSGEISIVFCDDDFIQDLNLRYRQKNEPTDVLSFCQNEGEDIGQGEEGRYYGDIIISLPALKRNVTNFNVSENEEVKRLLIHGILHLLGWDHETNDEDQEMLIKQEEILGKLQEVEIIK